MSQDLKPPVAYSPAVETREDHEAETTKGLEQALHDILETTSKDYGHAVRSVHAKSHGLLEAELTVHDDLPPEYAQGLFGRPGTYQAIMRISTNPGDILDDSISVPRGLAVKVIGVEGERLPQAEGDTQDFVMVNGKVFATPGTKQFLGNLKLLAKTTDKAEWAKKAFSSILRTTEKAIEALGGESAKLQTMGGAPNVHPLGETYYSATPFRYGRNIAKFSIAPVSENLTRHTGEEVATAGIPDALRNEIGEVFAEGGDAVWELRVQLNRDLDAMPIEDATVEWKEDESPFVTVATLRAPSQQSWSLDKSKVLDDQMRFSIWTGLADHQPLGQINRARNSTYEMSANFRGQFNGCPIHEPSAARASEHA